jgi:hypothetical protein
MRVQEGDHAGRAIGMTASDSARRWRVNRRCLGSASYCSCLGGECPSWSVG